MTVNSEPVDTLDTSATVLEAATEHETEQIVMQQVEGQVINGLEGMVEGQVIMMTNAAGEEQHVVITSAGSISQPSLNGGGQVIQVQSGGGLGDGGYLLDSTSMKSEPEDLSFTVPRHSMDLEAGAQAIQASAANAVQNVLRSLKETETKTIVTNQQLVPTQLINEVQQQQHARVQTITNEIMIPEDNGRPDSGIGDTPEPVNVSTPARRSRSQQDTSPRVQIAKQYTPFGFHNTLEAPTAQQNVDVI